MTAVEEVDELVDRGRWSRIARVDAASCEKRILQFGEGW